MTTAIATTRPTLALPDGFNGHTVNVFIDKVLDVDGDLLKFQVADEDKQDCIKWVRRNQLPFETVTETIPSNGNKITYKIVNSTAYHIETPDAVVQLLETYRQRGTRIRIFYGDTETGRDWLSGNDTIGTIGRSTGNIKIPLLAKTGRSVGGGALLDDCIVRITVDKQDVYLHPSYYQPTFLVVPNPYSDKPEYVEAVFVGGENHAAFKKQGQATRWIAFMKGERNAK